MLQMITKDLRTHASRFDECIPVTEAVLQFAVCTYYQCKRGTSTILPLYIGSRLPSGREEQIAQPPAREFIFSLAKKLGVSSLRIFTGSWQTFMTCSELQQLILSVAPPPAEDDGSSSSSNGSTKANPAPELRKIINEFYESPSHHDEDSCLLLTKYFHPGDKQYAKIASTILRNALHYSAAALFELAQLQAANRGASHNAVMDDDIFAIVSTALEQLGRLTPSPKILDYVDWVFTMCTNGSRREPARLPFYAKFISLICKDAPVRIHLTGIILRVLQRVDASHASLKKHSTTSELGLALIAGYRGHFEKGFWACSHTSYAGMITEMQRAELECRHYVKDGQALFQSEVVDNLRRQYRSKKKLMKLLDASFPPAATKNSTST